MAIKVQRSYLDAVTGKAVKDAPANEFIELLTHDAFFIQIPKIKGQMGTEMERVLCVFDQNRRIKGDTHRLEFEEKVVKTNELLSKIFRTLNRLQESPEMEKLMTMEDIDLFEKKEAVETAEREKRLREEEQKLREAAEKEVAKLRRRLQEKEDNDTESS